MKLFNVHRKYVVVGAVFIIVVFIVFVKSALDTKEVKRETWSDNENAFEVKPVVVYLKLPNGTQYRVRLENKDSVTNLLEYLRNNNNFWYEKTAYTYGTELENINGQKAKDGFRWAVFYNGVDITFKIESLKLENGAVYEIKQMPRD